METRSIVYVALFAALTGALALFPPITIPAIGVPVTAQTLGVMLAGGILGRNRGALSMMLFLVLVGLGLPLLAGGRGGIGVFASPSAGFLFGWIGGAFITGWLIERSWTRLGFTRAVLATTVGGIVVVYAFGIPWLSLTAGMPLWSATVAAGIFVPGDLVKAVVASAVILGVRRSYPLIVAR
ncbi:biotin transporter BioY [Minwuia thermotolerans]|uniref:Biotin transporter n=1 Tax=Minwuia thermotolerans TaxID=2056226 RepID=A0A2M9G5W6_9PROT|nr:biotin transporter BioY [Minwuia thermotolerans]PJK31094.1 biotin transporter BioY [Minwuia thermotolerans]